MATSKEDPAWRDKFGGKLVLVLLDNKIAPSIKKGRSLWGLQRPLTYSPGNGEFSITVPAGFVTDLASVPRWGWLIIPPDGPWVKAAIIHDYLYATGGTGIWKGHEPSMTRPQPYSRRETDRIMREAMENRGVGRIARSIIYAAVRIGGGPGWGVGGASRSTSEQADRFITD
jgi:hypothetical protein